MTQLRLHLTSRRPRSTELYSALEAEFEDDGLPLATVEIDEAAGLDEISVYAEADDASAGLVADMISCRPIKLLFQYHKPL
ncbi:MAG TPA: hypothetical protein PL183_09795, partial [Aquamicrobium sp.]|nr:hypothetical protein [Aquamicrobium sp.]